MLAMRISSAAMDQAEADFLAFMTFWLFTGKTFVE
jgi:hypothetical protein